MAKLVTSIRTYFGDGEYRVNRVEVEIPEELAKLIEEKWSNDWLGNCNRAKFLANNQEASVMLFHDDKSTGFTQINIPKIDTVENEVFTHKYSDEESED